MKKIFSILLIFVIIFGISGCTSAKPEDTVSSFFDAAKACDTEIMHSYFYEPNSSKTNSSASDSDTSEFNKLLKKYMDENSPKITYSIQNSEVNNDKATVTVSCRFVDGGTLINEAISEFYDKAVSDAENGLIMTDDEIDKAFDKAIINKLKTTEDTYIEKTIDIFCIKSNNKWYIDRVPDELNDILYSNLSFNLNDIDK